MDLKIDNVIRISSSVENNFFKYWFKFLLPFHGLTDREMEVASAFAKKRYELSKVISDDTIIDKVLLSDDTKREIRESCKISKEYFQVVMSKLRKSKVIINNMFNPRYIPSLKEEDGNYKLLLFFELKDGDDIQKSI